MGEARRMLLAGRQRILAMTRNALLCGLLRMSDTRLAARVGIEVVDSPGFFSQRSIHKGGAA